MNNWVKIAVIFALVSPDLMAGQLSGLSPDSASTPQKRDQRLGIMMEHSRNPGMINTGIGLNLELPVGKRLAFDYHFTIGSSQQSSLYMHYPYMFGLGVRGMNAFKGYENGFTNGIKFVMFLFCLVPEGISYRIAVTKNIQLVPYLHPFGEDYRKNKATGEEETKAVVEFGGRIVFNLNKKIFAMPHGGIKMYYHDPAWGVQGGITLGWRMNN